MRHRRSSGRRLGGLAVLVLAMSSGTFAAAQDRQHEREPREVEAVSRTIMKAMKGDWIATFSGVTGCGVSTMIIHFNLDVTGNGTQSLQAGHSAGCGDNSYAGFPVEIQTLNPDGSGFIAFGCDVGCGYGFTIQVSHNKQVFSMAAEFSGGNFLAGVAVKQLSTVSLGLAQESEPQVNEKATAIAVSDLQGEWTATFSGVTGCGVSTMIMHFNLDETGHGTQTLQAIHSAGCGDATYTGRPVQIEALNPDGRGFIAFDCGPSCGFGFDFQVSRNKELFNMSAQPVGGNFLAGAAVKKKTTARAVSDFEGDWTAAFSGLTGCGVSTLLIDFHLDAAGNGTQSLTAGHSVGCGDNSYTGFPVFLQALNPDGSGFIGFDCGLNCGFGFDFQISPNNQLFNMSAQPVIGNFLAGVAVRK